MVPLAALAEAEIRARHAFFAAWFAGTADADGFDATARAFAPDMHRIGPDGGLQDRDGILVKLQAARAAFTAGFAIDVTIGLTLPLAPDTVLVTYDERQPGNERRSTAVLSRDPGAPEGVVWRHVHETWITQPASADAANTEEHP